MNIFWNQVNLKVFSPNATEYRERASRFFSLADLEGRPVPPRQWLVPDLVPHRTVTILGGDGGTGKSLLALQLAISCALGPSSITSPTSQRREAMLHFTPLTRMWPCETIWRAAKIVGANLAR